MKEEDCLVKYFINVIYPGRKKGTAIGFEDGIIPRLRKDHINFFTPWGPRYSWKERGVTINEDDKEIQLLKLFSLFLEELKSIKTIKKKINWIFLGADIYGYKINNIPEDVVKEYFSSLKYWLKQIIPESEFKLWSEFNYLSKFLRSDVSNFLTKDNWVRLDKRNKKSNISLNPIMGSTKDYIFERLLEAYLIECLYQPVKISCAPSYKDWILDLDLPRLYITPSHLQVPWL